MKINDIIACYVPHCVSYSLSCNMDHSYPHYLLEVKRGNNPVGVDEKLCGSSGRITHPAPGVPEDLIQQMFHHNHDVSREGLGLFISQKLVKIMNGNVQYLREADRSSFIILVEFPLAGHID